MNLDSELFPFVETSVSKHVVRTIELTLKMGWNAAIVGAAGVGKTRALDAYVAANYNVSRIGLNATRADSRKAVLSKISEAVGLPYWGLQPATLDENLSQYVGPRHTVIIDEAQNLPDTMLRQLLSYSVEDGGQFNFIFSGNSAVLKKVSVDEGPYAQIGRRIPFRETVFGITDEDCDALANVVGLEGMDAYKVVRRVGRVLHTDGVVKLLKMAGMLTDGRAVQLQHIRWSVERFPRLKSLLASA